jgi:hypothetical protein
MGEERATVRMVQRKGKVLLNGLQAFTHRNETMRGAKGPNKVPRSTKERTKGWHDQRMKECGIGDKMLMNSSRCKASQARKVSSRKKRSPQVIYPSSHGAIILQ